ncbi:unnamed protein product [Amoebophrya sp. A25]|nr:unnamed protein product [Amoebophrya sp. A25]|eukprot:GSA25T00012339001.1
MLHLWECPRPPMRRFMSACSFVFFLHGGLSQNCNAVAALSLHRLDPASAAEAVEAMKKEIETETAKAKAAAKHALESRDLVKATAKAEKAFQAAHTAELEVERAQPAKILAQEQLSKVEQALHEAKEAKAKILGGGGGLQSASGIVSSAVKSALDAAMAEAQKDADSLAAQTLDVPPPSEEEVTKKRNKAVAASIQPYHLAIMQHQRLEQNKLAQAKKALDDMTALKQQAEQTATWATQLQQRGLVRKAFEEMAYARSMMWQAANLQERSKQLENEATATGAAIPDIQMNEAAMAAYTDTMEKAR